MLCPYPSGFQTKILYAFLISPMRYVFLAHIIILDIITLIIFGISERFETPHIKDSLLYKISTFISFLVCVSKILFIT
jgi:hypothetical protein